MTLSRLSTRDRGRFDSALFFDDRRPLRAQRALFPLANECCRRRSRRRRGYDAKAGGFTECVGCRIGFLFGRLPHRRLRPAVIAHRLARPRIRNRLPIRSRLPHRRLWPAIIAHRLARRRFRRFKSALCLDGAGAGTSRKQAQCTRRNNSGEKCLFHCRPLFRVRVGFL